MTTHSHIKFLLLCRAFLHACSIAGAFIISFSLRSITDLIPGVQLRIPPLDASETILFALISIVVFRIIAYNYKTYSLEIFQNEDHHIMQVFFPRISILASIAYFGFGFLFVGGISRFILVFAAILSFVFILIIEKIWAYYASNIYASVTIAVYGDDISLIQNIILQLQQESPYHYLNCSGQAFQTQTQATLLVGSYSPSEIQDWIDRGRGLGIPFFHITDKNHIEHALAQPQRIGGLLGWFVSTTPLQYRGGLIKRIFDSIVAFFGLLCCVPLFLVIAYVIQRESKGPVFYIQKRVGRGGKLFNFVKFRSMYIDDCIGEQYGGTDARKKRQTLIHSDKNVRKGILQKIQDDPRVTKVGRFLRKTSLDELPSLWNVLLGDMSLVGPRPHMPHEVEQYETRHKRLFTIKPGITGYAQLYGRDQVPFDEEAKLDLWYIQHRSFRLDIYILLATCKVVVKGR